jgi:hypothetical protein
MSLKQALLASVFTFGLTAQGHAADVTADQAKAVADQLRGFLAGLLTDRVQVPDWLMTVTPAGPAYTIVVQSVDGPFVRTDEAGKPTTAWLTATVRPEDGTRWHIDNLMFPSSYRLSPDAASALAGLMPSAPTAAAPKPASMEWRVRTQWASGVFDTAQASDSRLDFKMEGVNYESRNFGSGMDSHTTVEKMEGRYIVHPTGSGGVDYRAEATMDGYTAVSNNPAMGNITFKTRHATVRAETGAVMNAQVAHLIRTMIVLGLDANAADAKGPDAKADMDKAGRAALRSMIGMLKGIMTGVKVDETFEGLDVKAGPGAASADRAGVSFGGEAPADTLKAFMEFNVGGLKVVGLPPDMADFVPRSFVVRPTVSNIDVKALTQLASDAAADGADPDMATAQLMQLFTAGGVKIGFERFDADLGYASITGTGEATIVGPSAVQGTADIVITGFDSLLMHAAKLPNPAQAMAMLAMAKGFGKSQGDKTVWHIAISPDNNILVNGVDVTPGGRH